MKPTAYIETSVVSCPTARPSRDVVVAAFQEVTREWWRTASSVFELAASELVITEAEAGDADAASARLEVLKPVTLPNITENSEELAKHPLDLGGVPQQAASDAAHIANSVMRTGIEQACRRAGYDPPVICTPNELMEAHHADDTS